MRGVRLKKICCFSWWYSYALVLWDDKFFLVYKILWFMKKTDLMNKCLGMVLNKMKKSGVFVFLLVLSLIFWIGFSFALEKNSEIVSWNIDVDSCLSRNGEKVCKNSDLLALNIKNQELTFEQFIILFFQAIDEKPSDEYKDIQLKFEKKTWKIKKGTVLYDSLQRAVYLGVFTNMKVELDLEKNITQWVVALLLEKKYGKIFEIKGLEHLGNSFSKNVDLVWTINLIKGLKRGNQLLKYRNEFLKELSDILKEEYIYPEKVPNWEEYTGAKSFLETLGDPYTVYFPPTDAKAFRQAIYASFVGIWAYIDMKAPWELIILKPISGSPAEKSGLKIGDRVVAVDGVKITEKMNSSDASRMIKGEAGTKVKLTIERKEKGIVTILEIEIIRKKIDINHIETSTLDWNRCYMKIDMFSIGMYKDFKKGMNNFSFCEQYIFDVRSNPGGSLEDILKVWAFFVPKNERILTVRTNSKDEKYELDYSFYDDYFKDKKITVLIDKNSASASEIFAGIIQSYHPKAIIAGETSFWKGTVQAIINYSNGWLLKYTIAKWLIGKEKKSIDKKWVVPDYTIVDDPETEKDEVLEWVKRN